jgi:cytochrome c oxidase subunit 2
VSRKALLLPLAALCVAGWITGCGKTAAPGLARGEQIYNTCVPCHGKEGHGNVALAAPAIAGLPAWYVEKQLNGFKAGWRGTKHTDEAGQRMRPIARSLYREGDIPSLAQYVATLQPVVPEPTLTSGDAAAGEGYYQVCVACHQADGSGNEALGAPPLKWQQDAYMLAQLNHFKGGLRGYHPDDAMGQSMVAMAATLPDSTAIHDVIAFIRTLQK